MLHDMLCNHEQSLHEVPHTLIAFAKAAATSGGLLQDVSYKQQTLLNASLSECKLVHPAHV